MSYYREVLICRECGRRKTRNYFISETLCKKCAAKRRIPQPNPLCAISHPDPTLDSKESIAITARVETRLRREAEHEVPKTPRDHVAALTPYTAMAVFWAAGLLFGYPSLVHPRHDGYFLILMWWGTIIAGLVGLWVQSVLNRPRSKKVAVRLYEVAVKRAEAISDTRAFYASAEWNIVRKVVLAEASGECQVCGKFIPRKVDLTVDHILPRSKYPHLALERSNMQVLCRSCNSRKGDRLTSKT
jgi:hypothetical protein